MKGWSPGADGEAFTGRQKRRPRLQVPGAPRRPIAASFIPGLGRLRPLHPLAALAPVAPPSCLSSPPSGSLVLLVGRRPRDVGGRSANRRFQSISLFQFHQHVYRFLNRSVDWDKKHVLLRDGVRLGPFLFTVVRVAFKFSISYAFYIRPSCLFLVFLFFPVVFFWDDQVF